MPREPLEGNPSIFRGKDRRLRVQGILTKRGAECLEAARHALARLAHRRVGKVSDADTIEYLARGPVETGKYLRDADK